ncbi:MAG: S41 family peptidase [Bacteroidales bacterium]|nr:S41 family peptidase [Bacteroidales bacterium]
MKKNVILALLFGFTNLLPVHSQIPDDTNGRLYRLCKTWGYFKYFSQHKCELKWDTLLNTAVSQVLVANSNEEFNNALMAMFSKVGNNVNPGTQYPWPDTNLNFDDSWINDPVFSVPVHDFLDTFSLYIYPDTSACLVSLNDYSHPNYYSFIKFLDDPLSMAINLADEANRLTYMFYYWNVINYFFPYRYLMDQPWDSTLLEFIPLFRQVDGTPEFHITFLEMVTRINDTHGFTSSSVLTSYLWGGNYLPKIYFTRVDTNCVVTKVQGVPGVSPGDILTALKGIPVREIEDSLVRFIPASTPAAYYRDLYYHMMLGNQYTNISLTLSDSNGTPYTVSATRQVSVSGWYTWRDDNGLTSSYFITDCDYGYVHMGMLQPEEVPAMYEMLKDAPAIIFDIRNYPNGTLWDLGPLFFPEPVTSAIYQIPALMDDDYYFPGWYNMENDHYNLGTWFNPDAYDGQLYILVNEETQSQAEYTCQYLSYHPDSRVIGSQTAGADGNVSYLMLPGSMYTYFTSLGWYYADGYQQQRNGVKIDTLVYRTVNGIRQGRDELLEAALDCMTEVEEAGNESPNISVYPNPAVRQLTVGQLAVGQTDSWQPVVRITILDLFGRVVKDLENISSTPYLIDISDLADGMYILQVGEEHGIAGWVRFLKVSY